MIDFIYDITFFLKVQAWNYEKFHGASNVLYVLENISTKDLPVIATRFPCFDKMKN